MVFSEQEYSKFYQYSLNVAYNCVGYKEEAYDIAQNAMLSLLTTNTDIKSPFSWIRTVVSRESSKFYTEEKKKRDLYSKHVVELTVNNHIQREPEEEFPILDDVKVKEILSREDYAIYKKLKKVKFKISAYAEKYDLSVNTAKFHKKKILRDVQSSLLWSDGWRSSDKILSYNQYDNINRFIKTAITSIHNVDASIWKKNLSGIQHQDIKAVIDNIKECREWSVLYKNKEYRVMLNCLDNESKPKFAFFKVFFNNKNSVILTSAYEGMLLSKITQLSRNIEALCHKGKLTTTSTETTEYLSV